MGALSILVALTVSASALTSSAEPPPSAARLAGQRVVWSFPGTAPPTWLARGIRRGEVGAVLLFSDNGTDPAQVRRLVRRLQGLPRPQGDPPLLVMSDHEGGPVRRVSGPPDEGATELGRLPVRASLRAGRQAGRLLCGTGVNVDLAPVADLARDGSVIARQGRSFGSDPEGVARRAGAFARGLAQYGVAWGPKHFPGLGAARETTDEEPVTIDLDAATLRDEDMAPFARLITDGAPMVMVGTAVYPALAPVPAVLSPAVVVDELRGRLAFGGVVVADALDTPALAPYGGSGRVAVRAARADVDLMPFVSPSAAGEAQRALETAIRKGDLDRPGAQASLARVLQLRRALAGGEQLMGNVVRTSCPRG